ncbi:MAG: flippase-like domain-containing protein [Planctomycetales bacterium]|nr:flippase-like domain-containing protein [Planctomycetales bacterium]
MKSHPTLRKIGLVLKYSAPVVIIVWLLYSIDPEQRRQLAEQQKNWPLLGVAFVLGFTAVWLTFVRWWLLVRALGIPFRLRDAYRLGFLGYLLNFVSVGAVGGDLFKAVFIAHEHPGRRAEAVATVVVDRVIGLYALLVVTAIATLLIDMPDATPEMVAVCRATYLLTALGGAGVMLIMVPGFTSGAVSEFVGGLPKVGPVARKLITAVRMYRKQPGVLAVISVMSLAVHAILSLSVYVTARALYTETPNLAEHMIIVPLSMVAAAVPFTPAGLGTFEFAIDKLYEWVPAVETGVSGILMGLAYRVTTIAIAAVGVLYYWAARREVREVLEEAEQELHRDADGDDESTDASGDHVSGEIQRTSSPLDSADGEVARAAS